MGFQSGGYTIMGSSQRIITGFTRDVNPLSPTYGSVQSFVVPFDPVPIPKTQVYWSRSSQGTPGYHTLSRIGLKPPMHPFTYHRVETEAGTGGYFYVTRTAGGPNQELEMEIIDWQVGTGGYLSVPASPPYIDGSVANDLDRQCRTEVLLRCQNQKVNLAQMFAERKQTTDLVLNAATTVFKVITSLKKGNLVAAAEALGGKRPSPRKRKEYRKAWEAAPADAASRKWLELQYGWKPLLSDVYGACKAVAEAPFAKRTSVRATKRVSRATTRNTYRDGDVTSIREGISRTFSVTYHVEFVVTMPMTQSLGEVGLLNPAAVAWELVPFSFIVDWFLPVGNFINQFGATAGLSFVEGRKTVFQRGESTLHAAGHPVIHGRLGTLGHHGQKTATRKEVSVERTMLDAFPTPALPVLKNPFSLEHAANAVALLQQLISKR